MSMLPVPPLSQLAVRVANVLPAGNERNIVFFAGDARLTYSVESILRGAHSFWISRVFGAAQCVDM